MRALLVATVLLAACNTPSPLIVYRLDDTSVGQCPSTECSQVAVSCRTWMSIRIIDPAHPLTPYLTQCDEVPMRTANDLCAIAGINLKDPTLPLRDLEVQVAVFPQSMITKDAAGAWVCPSTTQYDASTGFPIASDQTPAIGGRGFYHSGDDTVVVNLGCTDLAPIQACGTGGAVPVLAEVDDFDSQLAFTGPMTVSVGEPASTDPFHVLGPPQLTSLTFDPSPTVRKWKGQVSHLPASYACLAVLDDAPQSTTSVACYDPAPVNGPHLDWPFPGLDATHSSSGVRLSKAALDQMLTAIGAGAFPTHGMTIGVVLDENGAPLANQTVSAGSGASISYFSGNRMAIDLGTRTTASGAFVSLDAPFGTVFSTGATPQPTISRIGGRIDGKVTIVVLKFTGGSGT